MKTKTSTILVALAFVCSSGPIFADSIIEVYNCELKEGKKQEELQAINSKWLKWVKENVDKGIESSVGTAVVGDQDVFLFADTYPNLAVWAATQTWLDSDAASELQNIFEDVSDCSGNRLWKFEPTK
jgi:hypothetical protein